MKCPNCQMEMLEVGKVKLDNEGHLTEQSPVALCPTYGCELE